MTVRESPKMSVTEPRDNLDMLIGGGDARGTRAVLISTISDWRDRRTDKIAFSDDVWSSRSPFSDASSTSNFDLAASQHSHLVEIEPTERVLVPSTGSGVDFIRWDGGAEVCERVLRDCGTELNRWLPGLIPILFANGST